MKRSTLDNLTLLFLLVATIADLGFLYVEIGNRKLDKIEAAQNDKSNEKLNKRIEELEQKVSELEATTTSVKS